ncbi:MAG: hypothetical protein V2A64_07830 [Candidatus Omnitrophota bacterium]
MKNNRAKSFVAIMIVIAVCALLLRIVIEQLIKINMAQNESHVSVALKQVSAALENYADGNQDVYPQSLSILTDTKSPYLDKDYFTKSPFRGYNFSCPRLEAGGYSCYASPVRCKLTGNMVYTISTGSLLVSEGCEKKE